MAQGMVLPELPLETSASPFARLPVGTCATNPEWGSRLCARTGSSGNSMMRLPIGNRIIELPEDPVRAQSRDPHSGFVAHVPTGSLAKGEALVSSGNSGKTIPCAICHGSTLQGLGEHVGRASR